MKRVYLGFLLLLILSAGTAQDYGQLIQVRDVLLHSTAQEMALTFVLQADPKAVKSDYSLIVLPILTNGSDSIALPEITIRGSRALIAEKRDQLAGGRSKKNNNYVIKNGESVSYATLIPYEEWMQDLQLVFSGIVTGCCSAKEVVIGSISGRSLPDAPVRIEAVEAVLPEKKLTTAERLAAELPFLAPVGTRIDGNREGALTIYFEQGVRVIDYNYKGNREALIQLVSAIRLIEQSADSRVAGIVIAGYASPEGSYAFNEQLAWDRGVALRSFVIERSSLSTGQITVYNGTVDWSGLRKLVEASERSDKYRVMEVIDAPEQNKESRLRKLEQLNGGETYRYLLNNLFPLLRNAAYVKVYYENY